MRVLLQKEDGSQEELLIGDPLVVGVAMVKRGEEYFVFTGYLGGFAHTALFTQCQPPLILAAPEPEQTPKPARKFMGQKPKEENNG